MPAITVTINPTQGSCNVNPPGDVHAPGKSQNGSVNFNTTTACAVQFDNSAVFGLSQKQLTQGNNQLPVQVDNGSTHYCFPGYNSGNGICVEFGISPAQSNPNQIIVP
jgi:hypothetical protein